MLHRRRAGAVGLGAALALTFTILLVMGTVRPGEQGTPVAVDPVPQGSSGPGTAAWMRKVGPGEKPPQFVLFSFDGAGSHDHWSRMLPLAQRVNAHFSGFLSGIYLLDDSQRADYTGPGHRPGQASVGFGGSAQDVRTRINDLNTAVANGHEIGTHYNGHFCQGAEPSVGRWTTAQWNAELDQFFGYLHRAAAMGLRVDPASVKGGRTPCLEGRWDQLWPALTARGMTYDSSQVSDGVAWPTARDGVWEFPMPSVRVPGLGYKKTIMMDYNFWYSLNRAKEEPARAPEFAKIVLDTYQATYQAAYDGNRAPMVVGNHFNSWSGGAFTTATEQFMGAVCGRPDTVCATYSEVIEWMKLQDPGVLDQWRRMPNAQVVAPR